MSSRKAALVGIEEECGILWNKNCGKMLAGKKDFVLCRKDFFRFAKWRGWRNLKDSAALSGILRPAHMCGRRSVVGAGLWGGKV